MRKLMVAAAALLLSGCQTVPEQVAYTPNQIAALEGNGFREVDGEWELNLDNMLLFKSGESILSPAKAAVVSKIARDLMAVNVKGGFLEGHADSVGAEGLNQSLSLARAEAVKAALAEGGMNPDNIRLVALGDRYPVDSNKTPRGRQFNRRVVLIVTPSDAATASPISLRSSGWRLPL